MRGWNPTWDRGDQFVCVRLYKKFSMRVISSADTNRKFGTRDTTRAEVFREATLWPVKITFCTASTLRKAIWLFEFESKCEIGPADNETLPLREMRLLRVVPTFVCRDSQWHFIAENRSLRWQTPIVIASLLLKDEVRFPEKVIHTPAKVNRVFYWFFGSCNLLRSYPSNTLDETTYSMACMLL